MRRTISLSLCVWLCATACGGRTELAIDFADIATAGAGADTHDAPPGCTSMRIEPAAMALEVPGRVLLVFDRSGSMEQDWNGRPRWERAGDAVADALDATSDALTIGAVFFPSPSAEPAMCVDPTGIACMFIPDLITPSATCEVSDLDADDQIAFVDKRDFLATFTEQEQASAAFPAMPKYAPLPGGRTPLSEALVVARDALASSPFDGPTAVVVVTDGEPNCEWDAELAQRVVSEWSGAGIDTYVLGLPGATEGAETTLNELAAHGGTREIFSPRNSSAIADRLSEIVQRTVRGRFESCTLQLERAPREGESVSLFVQSAEGEMDAALAARDGQAWRVGANGMIELLGDACEGAMDGTIESVRVELCCERAACE